MTMKEHEGTQVRWRNLKITDLDPPAQHPERRREGRRLEIALGRQDHRRLARRQVRLVPAKGWEIKNGVLTVLASGGAESAAGGDIITRERYSDFELKLDFKISPAPTAASNTSPSRTSIRSPAPAPPPPPALPSVWNIRSSTTSATRTRNWAAMAIARSPRSMT
jgi:hypothetical protein